MLYLTAHVTYLMQMNRYLILGRHVLPKFTFSDVLMIYDCICTFVLLLTGCVLQYKDMWSDLKAQAEALVLIANNIDGLLTCALRSCNVFGPGDTEFVPFLLTHAKFGWTKVGTYRRATPHFILLFC